MLKPLTLQVVDLGVMICVEYWLDGMVHNNNQASYLGVLMCPVNRNVSLPDTSQDSLESYVDEHCNRKPDSVPETGYQRVISLLDQQEGCNTGIIVEQPNRDISFAWECAIYVIAGNYWVIVA